MQLLLMIKKHLKTILLLLSVVFLFLFIKEMTQVDISQHLKQIGWGFTFVILLSATSYLLATLAWMYNTNKSFSFSELGTFFTARLIGETFATLNPTGIIGGDALKIGLMKKYNYSSPVLLESVAVTRIQTIISHLFLIIIIAFILSLSQLQGSLALVSLMTGSMILVTLLLGLLFFHKKLYLYKTVYLLSRKLRLAIIRNKLDLVREFNTNTYLALKVYPKVFTISLLALTIHWLVGILEYYIILDLIGIDVTFFAALLLEIGTSMVRSMVAFIPGQIGFEEYANKLFLGLAYITVPGAWIAISIIKRIRQLFWIGLALLLYLLVYQSKISSHFSKHKKLKYERTLH